MSHLKHTLFYLFVCTSLFVFTQTDIKNYEGQWQGTLQDKNTFNFNIELQNLENSTYKLSLFNKNFSFSKKVVSTQRGYVSFNITDKISFTGILEKDQSSINGFISSGFYFYHIQLKKTANNNYAGTWNIFMLNELLSNDIFLSIENVNNGKFDAFPFFGDQRFAGTACINAQKNKDTITFQDIRTGLNFSGILQKNNIKLNMLLGDTVIATTTLQKSTSDWQFGNYPKNTKHPEKPIQLNDGWKISKLKNHQKLQPLEDSIRAKKLANTHSILIAKNGKLVYENYFDGFNHNIPHDQRSASKSISSALIGIAIDKQLMNSEDDFLYQYIPKEYQYTKDSLKANIKLKDLLTMSSGLDAIDTKRDSKASEQAYQNSPNWLKTVLEAPMLYKAGTVSNYGSANPYLLGIALNEVTEKPAQLFINQNLLKPLQIINYTIQKDITGIPYFGGGMYITPRDMLKFGELYRCKGMWNGKRVISKNWVEKSFKKYHKLQNTRDKNDYGFLWWHKNYPVKGKTIASIEARGNGGQYIFVVPKLKLVCVITSGNFRNGKTKQPETIFEDYILPVFVE